VASLGSGPNISELGEDVNRLSGRDKHCLLSR
jgi:hypothetical protein